HDGRQAVRVLRDLRIEVLEVDRPVLRRLDDGDVEARKDRGGGVRAVRGLRDEADATVRITVGQVEAADRQQARELALRTRIGLEGDAVVAGDLDQQILEVRDERAPAGGLLRGDERVDRGELRPGDGLHL